MLKHPVPQQASQLYLPECIIVIIQSLKFTIRSNQYDRGTLDKDNEFRLYVITDALIPSFAQPAAKKSLSVVGLVMGWMMRA